jgi:4-hydroxy-tetrahydrodipicolinate reductase
MGAMIIRLIKADKSLELGGALEDAASPAIGKDIGEVIGVGALGVKTTADLGAIIGKADVVIDFSVIAATLKTLETAVKNNKAMVIGTTGFNDGQKKLIGEAAKKIPVVFTPNFSIGVNLLFKLVKEATKVLKDKDFDIEIVEAHHRFKKDAPSGTALKLAQIAADEKGLDIKKAMITGREGAVGERSKDSIGVFALRGGDIVGEHTVSYTTLGERIELTHKAHSRENFAKGALVAAKYLVKAKAGLYDMQDVLGIK